MTGTETDNADSPHLIAPMASEEIASSCGSVQNVRLSRACRVSFWLAEQQCRSFWSPQPSFGPCRTCSSSSDEAYAQNGQDRKLSFVNPSTDRQTTSSERARKPASPYIVQGGSVISAALITGLRSDLPERIAAQVTEPIPDTPTGRSLLIPQGARLIGSYDSQVAFGQSRVLLVLTRLGGRRSQP